MNKDTLPVSHNLKSLRTTLVVCRLHHLYLNDRVYTGGWGAER